MIRTFGEPLPGIDVEIAESRMRILDQGAQVVHWQVGTGAPILFASRASVFAIGHHVRAGAPLVFPWFGTGRSGDKTPVHGYARIRGFERTGVEEYPDHTLVHYLLRPAEPEDTPASLDVSVLLDGDSLSIAVTATNQSDTAISFEAGLHTYLVVGDTTQISLAGLEGSKYQDRATGARDGVQEQTDSVRIEGEMDRAYLHTGEVTIQDPVLDRTVIVSKSGSANTILWNPGEEKTRAFSDFGDDEWRQTVCVEAANIGQHAVQLRPAESHTMTQTLRVRPLQGAHPLPTT